MQGIGKTKKKFSLIHAGSIKAAVDTKNIVCTLHLSRLRKWI
jgi:hypothetical protein